MIEVLWVTVLKLFFSMNKLIGKIKVSVDKLYQIAFKHQFSTHMMIVAPKIMDKFSQPYLYF